MNNIGIAAISLVLCLLHSPLIFANQLSPYFYVDGVLYDEAGFPLEVEVSLQVQILDPSDNCVLYTGNLEAMDLRVSGGAFALKVGQPSGMATIFQNSSPISGTELGDPSSACVYNPVANDSRRLRLTVYDTNMTEIDVLAFSLGSSPSALVAEVANRAESVGDLLPDQILIENTSSGGQLTRENLSEVFDETNYPILRDLLNGVSDLYLRPGATGAINAGGQKISNLDEPTGAQDAATKNYVDSRMGAAIGGHNVAADFDQLGAAEDGQFLKWNGTLNQWEVADIDVDLSGAILADGTVTAGKLADNSVQTEKIADEAVTGVKIADNSISTAHIFAPVANQVRIVATDGGVTGDQLMALTCDEGEVLKWTTANGWDCTEDEVGGGDFMADGSVPMTGPIHLQNGTPTRPSLSFMDSPTTGIFTFNTDTINFTTLGTHAFEIGSLGVTSFRPIRGANGNTPTNVQYGFFNDADTGIYSPATDTLSFSTAGIERF